MSNCSGPGTFSLALHTLQIVMSIETESMVSVWVNTVVSKGQLKLFRPFYYYNTINEQARTFLGINGRLQAVTVFNSFIRKVSPCSQQFPCNSEHFWREIC